MLWALAHSRPPRFPQPQPGFALSPQNLSPDKIFHVIVAPCYDRKLEALREDVPTALHGSRGADCVLTSGEGVAELGTAGASGPSSSEVTTGPPRARLQESGERQRSRSAEKSRVSPEALRTNQTFTWRQSGDPRCSSALGLL